MAAMQLVLEIMVVLWVVQTSLGNAASLAKLGCQDRCGNVTIPYPFGIGASCSGHESYTIACNSAFTPPRPFLTSINLEVLEISFNGTVSVNSPVIKKDCVNGDHDGLIVNLSNSLFSFSNTYNRFTAMGCDNLALISSQESIIGGCMSACNSRQGFFPSPLECFGIMCCQTKIPPFLKYLSTSLTSIDSRQSDNKCKSAFIVDQDWFTNFTDMLTLQDMKHVPAVLDWSTYEACNTFDAYSITINKSVSLCGSNAFCSYRQLCNCVDGYEGNPFLPDGCQDIDECATPSLNNCSMICTNTPGSYDCSCIPGYYLSQKYDCRSIPDDDITVWMIFAGAGTELGLLLLLVAARRLIKVIKKKKKNMLKRKFFKRNGGLLLQKQLSSGKDNVGKTKMFTSKELEKATDNYNKNRILGQGGQGTVYKGMLSDGRIVAIKKSKIEDEGKLEHFINEVVILSQTNHRNVVKLHGCCLETEVPLLVYEFIPNGTLYQYIHHQNEDFPLTWEIRLQVAREIAAALSYLHSAASIPIYHRDIKSTNILLDEKYRAKMADFGTSRSISLDKTHLTTRVQGTFGYLDPEYFRSSQFTEKSDVYSFGVVLVELLTGKKPITSTESDEILSLATYFIMAMKENGLFGILDARVMKGGGKEEILELANLAKRCLNLNGRKRPTMKEVAMELEMIRTPDGTRIVEQKNEKVNYDVGIAEFIGSWDAMSTLMLKYTDTNVSTAKDA